MPDTTINDLNKDKNVLDENQGKDEEMEAMQAELFKVVYGTDPSNLNADSKENQEEKGSGENADKDEQSADEKSLNTEQSKEKSKQEKVDGEGDDYQEKYTQSLNKITELEGVISDLNQKIQSMATLNNLVKDLGLGDASQDQVQTVLKNVRQVADDLQNVPSLGQIVNKYYSGELQLEGNEEEKIPQDFMPEREVYSESDAFQDKTSSSFRAYRKFREWENQVVEKKRAFLQRIESERNNKSGAVEGFEKALRQLVDGFTETRADLVNHYPIGDDTWSRFIEFYRSGDPKTIKAAFAVFAMENKIKSKIQDKLDKNGKQTGSVLDSKTKKDEFYSEGEAIPTTDHDKQQKEYMKELGWIN
jgi:hypothetical protein